MLNVIEKHLMNTPILVSNGLCKSYESGMNSRATNMMYRQIKKSPDEISEMIRETWTYIKNINKSNHVVSHFLYLLGSEVDRSWVKDISLEIVKYGLNHDDIEVVDKAVGLIETWNDKDMLDLLYNTEIEVEWLNHYKMKVLQQFNYLP